MISKNGRIVPPTIAVQPDAACEIEVDGDDELEAVSTVTDSRDVQFQPGTRFRLGELTVELAHCLSLDRVVVTERRTGDTLVVARAELIPVETSCNDLAERPREFENVTEEELARAMACEEALRPHLAAGVLSRADAFRLAKTLGVSTRTVRRWVQRYKHRGDVTAFLQAPRGVRHGQSFLDPVVEAIISFAVQEKLHNSGNCTVRAVYPSIGGDCRDIGKAVPAKSTVLDRIKRLKADPESLPEEVGRQLRERTRLNRGSAPATGALARVEIDHTLVDTHIVDAKDGGPLGRPWLTIAIDVFTRAVLGFLLTLDHPSRLSVALCLRHAVLPKEAWLQRVGAIGPWPMFGRPRCIYTDNGAEFRSPSFRLGCQRQKIQNGYRPPRTPRYGGTVERLIGTFMRRMRLIPGNTFNEILNKRSPYAAQRAVLTLEDLERWLTNEITAYHHEPHRMLGMSPHSAWEQAWRTPRGIVLPTYPADPQTLFTDLLPHERRFVSPAGIHLYGLRYRSDELAPYVDPDIKRVIRIDPRDISFVSLERPEGGYIQVPWTNQGWPRLTLWEWNEIRSRNGKRDRRADPEVVRQCLAENDRLIGERVAQGQLRARRRRARGERWRSQVALDPSTDTSAEVPKRRARRKKLQEPAALLPPLPRNQLEVTLTSIESPVAFEVLE